MLPPPWNRVAAATRGGLLFASIVLASGLASPALAQPASPATPPPSATAVATPTPSASPTAAPRPPAGGTPTPAPTTPPAGDKQASGPAAPPPTDAPWAVNFEPTVAHTAADENSEVLGALRQFTYLQILGYEDIWARVYDPRTRSTVYVPSDVLGPVDVPPPYIAAPPPAAIEAIGLPGRVVGGANLAFYPTPAEEAQTARLRHNEAVFIAEAVQGEDGETWYRTSEGDYLPASAVRLPRTPPVTFPGRWIDADLAEPALLTAYEDDRAVMATLTIKGSGSFQTPQGVFAIQRRVASETMSSETIGIPRNGPGGYYLKNVLFTQYFRGTGESIHYNYWSSVWGYPGSHGCLGLPYAEAEFLWGWADVGTPVSIHY